ncbi:DNA base-flipping protein [Thalassocella blandensis]|nr:DNA base-flipping protein [Thalassocella blandensis]
MHEDPKQAIFRVLQQIPVGTVTTYGRVASLAGLGKASRYVGTTLKHLPKGTQLPWHRVINSQGRISFPESHPGNALQRELLEREGVVVINGKINLKQFLWQL